MIEFLFTFIFLGLYALTTEFVILPLVIIYGLAYVFYRRSKNHSKKVATFLKWFSILLLISYFLIAIWLTVFYNDVFLPQPS